LVPCSARAVDDDGDEIDVDEKVLRRMLKIILVRFAKNVIVPVLIIHRKDDEIVWLSSRLIGNWH
jgi:hypothetical protein